MPLFEYAGFDTGGRRVTGTIDSNGRKAASQALRDRGVFPTSLEPLAVRTRGYRQWFGGGQRVAAAELATVTRQLATLIGAGLALDDALGTVAEQAELPQLHRTLISLREEVRQGESLHAALSRQPKIFPDLYVSIVRVGEDSGTLDQALARMADFLENQARISSRIQAALAYPLLMSVVGIGVLGFLFTFVVPKITRMLEELGQALPWPTVILIQANRIATGYWWLFLPLLAATVYMFDRYRRTEHGCLHIDRLLLDIPVFGRLQLLIATARFARTLSILLSNGVPLLKALEIARGLLGNSNLRQAVEKAGRRVQEGGSLAAALRESALFPPMLIQVTAAGEKSGQLEEMLTRVADSYEHQTDLAITGMLSLLEPLMILVMGGVVGFVVLAILLPIFQASQGFG
ncbi:MAG: type II secretion system inner membrane protein GspF [Desulfuromonadales bacterium]|nr:type II secretion system inner membrane protein GspF [Desulfuromonadales bacterium]